MLINFNVRKFSEEVEGIARAADGEPDGAADGNHSLDTEHNCPPEFPFFGGEFADGEVVDGADDEGETPACCPYNHGDVDDLVGEGEFVGDAHDAQDFRNAVRLSGFCFLFLAGFFDCVFAAVQQLVHVERLFAGGQGNNDIDGVGEEDCEDGHVDAVDDRVGAGKAEIRPDLLGNDASDGNGAAGEQSGPGRGGGAAFPIEPTDDGAGGAADIDGAGDFKPHVDEVLHGPDGAEDESNRADESDGPAQVFQVLFGGEGFLAEGHDDILQEDGSPGVVGGVVGGDRRADHENGEEPEQARREQMAQDDRDEHLRLQIGVGNGAGGLGDFRLEVGIDRIPDQYVGRNGEGDGSEGDH